MKCPCFYMDLGRQPRMTSLIRVVKRDALRQSLRLFPVEMFCNAKQSPARRSVDVDYRVNLGIGLCGPAGRYGRHRPFPVYRFAFLHGRPGAVAADLATKESQ